MIRIRSGMSPVMQKLCSSHHGHQSWKPNLGSSRSGNWHSWKHLRKCNGSTNVWYGRQFHDQYTVRENGFGRILWCVRLQQFLSINITILIPLKDMGIMFPMMHDILYRLLRPAFPILYYIGTTRNDQRVNFSSPFGIQQGQDWFASCLLIPITVYSFDGFWNRLLASSGSGTPSQSYSSSSFGSGSGIWYFPPNLHQARPPHTSSIGLTPPTFIVSLIVTPFHTRIIFRPMSFASCASVAPRSKMALRSAG